jgi:hypothetical protein
MVQSIADSCTEIDENNQMKQNFIAKELVTKMSIISMVTNISDEDNEDEEISLIQKYDLLFENGIFDYVMERINNKTHELLIEGIYREISQRIENYNSLSAVVSRLGNKLIEAIPTTEKIEETLKNAKESIDGFDIDKLGNIKELANSLGLNPNGVNNNGMAKTKNTRSKSKSSESKVAKTKIIPEV